MNRVTMELGDYIFFIDDDATAVDYTLSLHDALPISFGASRLCGGATESGVRDRSQERVGRRPWDRSLTPLSDRKSTRLNSSHVAISYAVFCLKKKKSATDVWTSDLATSVRLLSVACQ